MVINRVGKGGVFPGIKFDSYGGGNSGEADSPADAAERGAHRLKTEYDAIGAPAIFTSKEDIHYDFERLVEVYFCWIPDRAGSPVDRLGKAVTGIVQHHCIAVQDKLGGQKRASEKQAQAEENSKQSIQV